MIRLVLGAGFLVLTLTAQSPATARDDAAIIATAVQFGLDSRDQSRDVERVILDLTPLSRLIGSRTPQIVSERLRVELGEFNNLRNCDSEFPIRCALPEGSVVVQVQELIAATEPAVSVILWRNGRRHWLEGQFFKVRLRRDESAPHGWTVAAVLVRGVT